MADQFDFNWGKFAKAVGGKYYAKKNDVALNYESHFIEFSANNFSIQIEVFIQLEPTKKSYSTFLERYTMIRLSSNQNTLQKFELNHKGFLNGLFSKKNKTSTGLMEFDSKYQIKTIPEKLIDSLFDSRTLKFFVEQKIIAGNLISNSEELGNVIELKFPEILYTTEEIEEVNRMINKVVKTLN